MQLAQRHAVGVCVLERMPVVVFGNSRAKALHDYVTQREHGARGRPHIRVIVHDFPFHVMEADTLGIRGN